MTKVIFLDIDGVLNSNFWNDNHQNEISEGTLIDGEKVRLLGQLVRSTGAGIVLHSGWKYWFDEKGCPLRREAEKLQSMLAKEGMKIAGITPDHSTEEIRRTKRFSLIKAGEILAWLTEHAEVKQWVVLDDLDLHNEQVALHQVRTDVNEGLTQEDVRRAEELLGLVEKRNN